MFFFSASLRCQFAIIPYLFNAKVIVEAGLQFFFLSSVCAAQLGDVNRNLIKKCLLIASNCYRPVTAVVSLVLGAVKPFRAKKN